MMKYSIRKTSILDIDDLIRIEKSAAQSFLATGYSWISEAPTLTVEQHEEFIKNNYAFVIADELDKAAGFIYAKKYQKDFYILEIDVDLNSQKQGLGHKLLNHVIEMAIKENYKSITLTTFIDVVWNRQFYEKSGFRVLGSDELPKYLENILEEEIKHGLPGEKRCAMQLNIESLNTQG